MPVITPELQQKLNAVRANHSWAVNFTDEVLLIQISKNPTLLDPEEVKWFVWGEDPITGRVIPAVSQWSQPILGIGIAIIALFFVLRMK